MSPGTTAYALTRIDGVVVLMIRGPLDDAAMPTFAQQLDEALIAAGPGQPVRVDVRGTSDVSPAAFGLLAIFSRRLQGTGRPFALVADDFDDDLESDTEG